jgi:hypothetical protein
MEKWRRKTPIDPISVAISAHFGMNWIAQKGGQSVDNDGECRKRHYGTQSSMVIHKIY